jgi:hypothetical protein
MLPDSNATNAVLMARDFDSTRFTVGDPKIAR